MNVLEQQIENLSLFSKLKERFPIEWNDQADAVLEARYYIKDIEGKITETKEDLIYRVVSLLADGDETKAERYYEMMSSGKFLPNTPTLVNAQRPLGMLSACLVLPTGDSIEEWADSLRDHMIMNKAGVGTGFDVSPLRQKGARVSTTGGEAAGALSLLRLLNASAQEIRQGSIRPSANMVTMRITHPEIKNFITMKKAEIDKETGGKIFNKIQMFNMSVTAFEDEFNSLFRGERIKIIEPHTKKHIGWHSGRELMELITDMVWDGGDPGLLNLSEANKDNPIINMINPLTGEKFGLKWATNPCGEQWLYIYSVCNLGSIDLSRFVDNGRFDFNNFAIYVEWGIEFLNDVVSKNQFPIEEINIMSRYLRNVGLGIMGWADALLKMNIKYNSQEALDMAELIMGVFKDSCDFSSRKLAERDGVAPVFRNSRYDFRNYERSCIAPTGTISFIVGTSSGIEPNFSYGFTRKSTINGGTEFYIINPVLKEYVLTKYNGSSNEMFKRIAQNGGIISNEIAMELGTSRFVSTFEVSPAWQIKHQAIFQKYVDNAVSKTINVPENFTKAEIEKAYKLAWELGLKGITIYRDKSRDYQVLNSDKNTNNIDKYAETHEERTSQEQSQEQRKENSKNLKDQIREAKINRLIKNYIPNCCDNPNEVTENGCTKCLNCGWSKCG